MSARSNLVRTHGSGCADQRVAKNAHTIPGVRSIGWLGSTLAAAALLASTPALAQKTITWRVQSHWPTASTSYKDSLQRIKDRVATCSKNQLVLELHESGALFPATETYNAVRRGVIQMGTISPGYLPQTITTAGIAAGLPFAFRSVLEAIHFQKNLGFENVIREEVGKQGVYYATDKVYTTEMVSKDPIKSMDDFRKMKIRSSGALQRYLTAAGAAASYMPGPEIYPALSTGVINGVHWGAAQGANSMGLYEAAKYHIKPSLAISGVDAFIVNQKALDALPADVRQCVYDELEAQFWARSIEYEYLERVTLAKAAAEKEVIVNELPPEMMVELTKVAEKQWDEEAKKGPLATKAVEQMKAFLKELGYVK